MAIVHVVYKSSSQAPPAAAHAQYLARDGQYEKRGGLELLESGNMPEFAQADPFAFWVAADAHERANGRAYTEIQVALPREFAKDECEALARQAVRELMGERSPTRGHPSLGRIVVSIEQPKVCHTAPFLGCRVTLQTMRSSVGFCFGRHG